jgi:hypothetical protein
MMVRLLLLLIEKHAKFAFQGFVCYPGYADDSQSLHVYADMARLPGAICNFLGINDCKQVFLVLRITLPTY